MCKLWKIYFDIDSWNCSFSHPKFIRFFFNFLNRATLQCWWQRTKFAGKRNQSGEPGRHQEVEKWLSCLVQSHFVFVFVVDWCPKSSHLLPLTVFLFACVWSISLLLARYRLKSELTADTCWCIAMSQWAQTKTFILYHTCLALPCSRSSSKANSIVLPPEVSSSSAAEHPNSEPNSLIFPSFLCSTLLLYSTLQLHLFIFHS